jgi:uncharacterized membrane protein YkvA (DUF1232 family)
VSLWQVLIPVALGLVVLWGTLVLALYLIAEREKDPATLRDVLRLVPDVVRLIRRLAADPTLPRGVRWRLSALVVYLVLPVDLIPDFIPVVGYADDAVIVAVALRSVVRVAGVEAIDRHWPGTEQGLVVVKRLSGVSR